MRLSKKQKRNARLIIDALRDSDISEEIHIGILCVIMGESHLMPIIESGYKRSTNERIRKVFGRKRLGAYFYDDKLLNQLRSDTEAFFNQVYKTTAGNCHPGDGNRYRGRGFIQLTGRGNYRLYSYKGCDLEKNPTSLRRPEVAAKVAVKYYRRQLNKIKNLACNNDDAAVAIAANVTAGLGHSVYDKTVQRAIERKLKYIPAMRKFYDNYIAEKDSEQDE